MTRTFPLCGLQTMQILAFTSGSDYHNALCRLSMHFGHLFPVRGENLATLSLSDSVTRGQPY